jgi:hypothetical protein
MNLNYGVRSNLMVWGILIPGFFLRAYVLAALWRWFAVPAGAPVIGLAHAYGLATLAQFSVFFWPTKDRDIAEAAEEEQEATRKQKAIYVGVHFVKHVLGPAIALGMGYVCHWAMTP